ncbi:multicopper oxidase family protein [Longimicrobium terrae]|uniref:FtsP/CotA-like multicopper oxidase with cupredoxin domain n=1 Tax=Longimicrobium terrae TaxID=1639882 RepID=A0A841H7I3_9BACT|nr:multicopper oxidase family protein [Longimicrobium terrae]MBB4639593.1 FtsP/CotA-like multicopper oxidase with cupredoxin domain [Longimicrobium terrae]MBB6073948.1 FtsP/CotA-like multicopper oxidase with cupredoxin domain [Longimicrobium terrae]NNC29113.1 multicopper oxidase family protein [Longimicrobium terrae]
MRRLIVHAAASLLAAGMLATHAAAQHAPTLRAVSIPPTCQPVADPVRVPVQGATLRMAPATYRIGSRTYETNVYNGQFVAPTLVMKAGDQFRLSVVNAMRATTSQTDSMVNWTNFHTHGLVVTPSPDSGDNVTHVRIPNGGTRRPYHFPVPSYHTEGMFWYHPHPHGITGPQVAGGLSGALLVGSILKYFPQYRGVRERTLLVRDMSFSFADTTRFNINGSTCAAFPIAPGEQQLWHIGNFGANEFINLKLQGRRWILLALDGNPLAQATPVDSLYLPPGSRAEVIVTGPAAGERVGLVTARVFPDTTSSVVPLGYLIGTPSASARMVAEEAPAGLDKSVVDTLRFLTQATDVQRETFRYSFPDGGGAAINDTLYEPNHLPVSMPWGQVQEWTIINETQFLHTFHIHQTDFAVLTVNGRPANEGRLRDNIPIGVHRNAQGQTVGDTVVIRFVFEPIAAGPFVFHCHVLQHEDEGMMHNVCVYDPRDPNGRQKCNSMFSSQPSHAGH